MCRIRQGSVRLPAGADRSDAPGQPLPEQGCPHQRPVRRARKQSIRICPWISRMHPEPLFKSEDSSGSAEDGKAGAASQSCPSAPVRKIHLSNWLCRWTVRYGLRIACFVSCQATERANSAPSSAVPVYTLRTVHDVSGMSGGPLVWMPGKICVRCVPSHRNSIRGCENLWGPGPHEKTLRDLSQGVAWKIRARRSLVAWRDCFNCLPSRSGLIYGS